MNDENKNLSVNLKGDIENEPALAAYFYNDNCPPCISLRPKVEALIKQDFPKMKLLFINSEGHGELCAQYGIFSNPTILLFFDGREYKRFSKYISTSELKNAIARPYEMIFS